MPDSAQGRRRRWRMPWVNAGIGLIALMGVVVMMYPHVASWVAQYYQSLVIEDIDAAIDAAPTARLEKEIERARLYNDALTGGALVSPESNIPTGAGTLDADVDYFSLLNAGDGVMGRLRIPSIAVDLPIYHGTSDEVLETGVGHLQDTSLPIGGASQHSVLTAHRGLPSATLFNDLGKMKRGETFTVEVFGEVLTYRVIETQTVLPDETQSLRPVYGEDLVTLVTCTPLGINTHRYLVTGSRVIPTPIEDIERAGTRPDIPSFPWWAVGLGAAVLGYVGFVAWSGRVRAPNQLLPAVVDFREAEGDRNRDRFGIPKRPGISLPANARGGNGEEGD
ncbi:MAG: class C sortase [Tessaracoccus sp.]|uniref:class C sortase n=1 Tax=Tessaracoccus sp. TaxID=1971211 RepID=UPI001ECF1ED0|nr:class C sortase [Tessaracoccus sp.]MBK7821978.1 class C sortase [Tessaracoccus sp.]